MLKTFRRISSVLKRYELLIHEQNTPIGIGQRLTLCTTTLSQDNKSQHVQTLQQHMKEVFIEGPEENDKHVMKTIGLTQEEQWRVQLLHPDQPPGAKVLRVAIIGAPNTGKSTLTNKLMGWRVSAVSAKVHTTRNKTTAILTEGDKQLILLDTPGIVKKSEGKRYNLGRQCVLDPTSSIGEADLVGVIVDASNKWTNTHLNKEILRALYMYTDKPAILIINKVDILKSKHLLLEVIRLLTEGVVDGQRDSATMLTPSELKQKAKEDPYQFIKNLKQELQSQENKQKPKNNDEMRKLESDCYSRSEMKSNKGDYDRNNGHHSIEAYQNETTIRNVLSELDDNTNEANTSGDHYDGNNELDSCEAYQKEATIRNVLTELGDGGNETKTKGNDDDNINGHGSIENSLKTSQIDSAFENVLSELDHNINGSLQYKNMDHQSANEDSQKQKFKPLPKSKKYDPTKPFLEQLQSAKDFKAERKVKKNASKIPEEVNSNWITEHSKLSEINAAIRNKRGWENFKKVFIVSSTTGEGVADLRDYLFAAAKPGDWLYHSTMVTDQNPAEIAKMCVWEKCMNHLPEEIPYSIDVEIVMWEIQDGLLRAIMNINCYKQRHVSFVVGKAGRMIQQLAMEAKQELMNSFKCDMTLKLIARLKTPKE